MKREKETKFEKGDLVRVAKEASYLLHNLTGDIEAVVTYAKPFGKYGSYSLYIKGFGRMSWFDDTQLELISHDGEPAMAVWKQAAEILWKERSNIDWIFAHGAQVLEKRYTASITTLASAIGINSLWGSHGEGISFYENSLRVLAFAESFLQTGDKEGWLAFAKECKGKVGTVDYHITGRC